MAVDRLPDWRPVSLWSTQFSLHETYTLYPFPYQIRLDAIENECGNLKQMKNTQPNFKWRLTLFLLKIHICSRLTTASYIIYKIMLVHVSLADGRVQSHGRTKVLFLVVVVVVWMQIYPWWEERNNCWSFQLQAVRWLLEMNHCDQIYCVQALSFRCVFMIE